MAKLDEFLHLEAKEIEKWISPDEITVKEEADVFKIILDWINHRKSERKAALEELFGHVRLGFLSRDCLEDVATNELVRENLACVKLVMDATIQMATLVNFKTIFCNHQEDVLINVSLLLVVARTLFVISLKEACGSACQMA